MENWKVLLIAIAVFVAVSVVTAVIVYKTRMKKVREEMRHAQNNKE